MGMQTQMVKIKMPKSRKKSWTFMPTHLEGEQPMTPSSWLKE
jgi:hypothetical protein